MFFELAKVQLFDFVFIKPNDNVNNTSNTTVNSSASATVVSTAWRVRMLLPFTSLLILFLE